MSTQLPPCNHKFSDSPINEIELQLDIGFLSYRQIEPVGDGYHKILMETLEAKEKKVFSI